jgi:hypothetical protein
MTRTTSRLVAAGTLVLALVVAGCAPQATTDTRRTTNEKLTGGLPSSGTDPGAGTGAGPSGAAAATPTAAPADGPFGSDGPAASDTPDPELSDQPLPTLPSGDPGTGTASPGGPEPTRPVPAVPGSALLDVATVAAAAGGDWVAAAAPDGWCASPRTPGAAASRSQLLTSDGGRLVQTVSAYDESRPAVRAVAAATTRLQACGFRLDRDPRLGEASELLTRTGPDGTAATAVVLATDGVGVVLLGSGSPTAPDVWDSLVDLALGSSCAAAADGCH